MPRSSEPPTPARLSCDDALDRLELYLDGLDGSDGAEEGLAPLANDERTALEVHLSRCPSCARALSHARQVRDELRALPEPPLPADAGRRDQRPSPQRRLHLPGPWRWVVPVAAAAGVAIALGLALLPGLGPSDTTPGDATPDASRAASQAVSPERLARAELEARYALARLAQVTQKARHEMRDEVLAEHVVAPMQESLMRSFAPLPRTPREPDPREPSSL